MTENEVLQTPFGVFCGVSDVKYAPAGGVRSLRLSEQNVVVTHAGDLIPAYVADSLRRKYKPSVTFHPNGTLRSVSLEAQQEIQTPIGEFPAELVTFYDTGELKRVFPLDGKISGFWSEEEERARNIPLSFSFPFAEFRAMLSGLCFYKSGDIRSLTLYPGEEIDLCLPDGQVLRARTGFSLYEDGALSSAEPAAPAAVRTPIGTLRAFDPQANGLCADACSLSFDPAGRITGLKTANDRVTVHRKSDGALFSRAPAILQPDPEEEGGTLLPLAVLFDYDTEAVTLTEGDGTSFCFCFQDDFFISPFGDASSGGCSPADCASCRLGCGQK